MDAALEVLDFGHGPIGFCILLNTGSPLLNVNETAFVVVDERTKEHAAHEAEDGGVSADTEGKGSDDSEGQPFGASEGPHGNSDVLKQQLRFNHGTPSPILSSNRYPRTVCAADYGT